MVAKEIGEQVTWDKFLEVAVEIFNLEKSSFVHLTNKYIETFPSGEGWAGETMQSVGTRKQTRPPTWLLSMEFKRSGWSPSLPAFPNGTLGKRD